MKKPSEKTDNGKSVKNFGKGVEMANDFGEIFSVYGFLLLLTLPLLGTVYFESVPNESGIGSLALNITFDRLVDCRACGQHKTPPLTDVNMTISAAFSGTLTDVNLTDYFPVEWSVTDSNGGTIESYNTSHNRISWHYDSITGSVSQWYIIRSPDLIIPPVDYYFISELAGQQSDPWRVIVADAYTITGVDIQDVRNTYRGDYDDITCRVTMAGSTGVAVTIAVSLQYFNNTNGWINASVSNQLNISQLSTNPQINASAKLNFNMTFNVLAMRTGNGNIFRCNASGDATPHYFISSNSSMTILTPNLQLNLTNTSTASVMADDTNDFNITVNVTTKLGNASSVHAYLQWNSSTSATWTNITTTATDALYADVATPILYTNVENVSIPNTQLYKINAHTAGTYWFRAYSNSSIYDGSFTNTTSAYPLTVQTPPADTTPPNINGWKWNVTNATNYSSTQGYQFNATVTDGTGISYVWIEHNFTGTMLNYTTTGNNGDEYYYNYNGRLATGFYYIKWYANDTLGYLNNTDFVKYYQVNKSYLPIFTFINLQTQNVEFYNYSTNASAMSIGGGFVNFTKRIAEPATQYWFDMCGSDNLTQMAATFSKLLLPDTIYLSNDSYATVYNTSLPAGSGGYHRGIACDSDRSVIAVGTRGGSIYISTNSGATWTLNYTGPGGTVNPVGIGDTNSSGGMIAFGTTKSLTISNDTGNTWWNATIGDGSNNATNFVDMTPNGTMMIAGTGSGSTGGVYASNNSGLTWTKVVTLGGLIRRGGISDNGKYMAVVNTTDYIYTSADYGTTWTQRTGAGKRYWQNVRISGDGQILVAVAFLKDPNSPFNLIETIPFDGAVAISIDNGATWANLSSPSGADDDWGYFYTIALRTDGKGFAIGSYATATEATAATGHIWTYLPSEFPPWADVDVYSNLSGSMTLTAKGNFSALAKLNLKQYPAGNYSIVANWTGNENFTSSQGEIYIIQLNGPGWLNVSYQSPASGSSQNLNQYDTFNISMNVTCIGGTCGIVNATLKYNATASYPNTDMSNITGATPFFLISSLGTNTTTSLNATALLTFREGSGTIAHGDTNNINATLLNAANWKLGIQDYALNWSGLDEAVNLTNSKLLNISGNISISFWINTSIMGGAASGAWMVFDKGQTPNGIYFYHNPPTATYLWDLVTYNGGSRVDHPLGDVLQPNTWYHIIWIINGTGTQAYVNGQLNKSWFNSPPSVTDLNPQPMILGDFGVGGGFKFNGSIDEFMVFNRTLSTAEIANLYIRGYVGGPAANPKSCSNMVAGDNCSMTWQVNATGETQYWLNVTFASDYNSISNNSGNFQINITSGLDTTPPNIAGWAFNVTNATNYSSTQGYQFNATVTDTTGISYVWVEQNFTGTLVNTTVTSCGTNVYCYNVSTLAANTISYYMKWYANDTGGYLNNTDWVHYYQVSKSYLPITLYINGTNGNTGLYNTSWANFTANLSSSYNYELKLYTNFTGGITLWDTQNSPLANYTDLNPYPIGDYLILVNWTGNENYSASSTNHTLTLQQAPYSAFSITIPGGNFSNSSLTAPGNANPAMNFSYNKTYGGSQFYVNASFNYSGATFWQDSANPALTFNNLGTQTLTWSITLNTSLPSWVVLFANDTNAIPNNGQTLGATPIQFSIPVGSSKGLWVYANFTNVVSYGGYVNRTALNHTSA